MAGSTIATIGPFTGGLNNVLDPTSVADNELVECVNFEITEEGTLTSRPPITVNQWGHDYGTGGNGSMPRQTNGKAVVPIAVGRYKNDGAAVLYKYFAGKIWWERMNNAANSLTIGLNEIDGFDQTGNIEIGHTAVQYQNAMYFTNARQKNLVGKITIGSNTFTPIATMPTGQTILNHKSRLFVFPGPQTLAAENDNNSKFFYSSAPYDGGNNWDVAKNFVNVGFGDGQYISSALVYNGDILIFKENSTWRFAYEANIGQGSLDMINANVGSYGAHTTTMCNGAVYTFYEGDVHEIFNYQWQNISRKVKFTRSPLSEGEGYVDGITLNSIGDRVILSYYGRMYVYSQRSRTWSEWESENAISRGLNVSAAVMDDRETEMLLCSYYKHTNKPAEVDNNWRITRLFRIFDSIDAIFDVNKSEADANSQNREEYELRLRTKSYDLGIDSAFKRLMWWGASVLTRTDVQGQATVVVNNAGFTWDDLNGVLYSDLERSTWDSLLDILPNVTTDVDSENYASHGRKFIKFLKGLRFRQIYFTYKTIVDGTNNTIPSKVFSFTAVYRGKTKMAKELS